MALFFGKGRAKGKRADEALKVFEKAVKNHYPEVNQQLVVGSGGKQFLTTDKNGLKMGAALVFVKDAGKKNYYTASKKDYDVVWIRIAIEYERLQLSEQQIHAINRMSKITSTHDDGNGYSTDYELYVKDDFTEKQLRNYFENFSREAVRVYKIIKGG